MPGGSLPGLPQECLALTNCQLRHLTMQKVADVSPRLKYLFIGGSAVADSPAAVRAPWPPQLRVIEATFVAAAASEGAERGSADGGRTRALDVWRLNGAACAGAIEAEVARWDGLRGAVAFALSAHDEWRQTPLHLLARAGGIGVEGCESAQLCLASLVAFKPDLAMKARCAVWVDVWGDWASVCVWVCRACLCLCVCVPVVVGPTVGVSAGRAGRGRAHAAPLRCGCRQRRWRARVARCWRRRGGAQQPAGDAVAARGAEGLERGRGCPRCRPRCGGVGRAAR